MQVEEREHLTAEDEKYMREKFAASAGAEEILTPIVERGTVSRKSVERSTMRRVVIGIMAVCWVLFVVVIVMSMNQTAFIYGAGVEDITRTQTEAVSTLEEVIALMNANLLRFNTKFRITIEDFDKAKLPASSNELEFAFIEKIEPKIVTYTKDIAEVEFTVSYTAAGQVIAGKALDQSAKARALDRKITSVILPIISKPGMTDYDKAVAVHDYIVSHVKYDDNGKNAYDAIMYGRTNCQGYAEATALLLTKAKLSNRLVWAVSELNKGVTHGFNKVCCAGKWYILDCTADDPTGNGDNEVRHAFCMTNDNVMRQKYKWDESRYPAATQTRDTWFHRNKLVVSSLKEMTIKLKQQVDAGKTQVTVYFEKYNTQKYSKADIREAIEAAGIDVKNSTVKMPAKASSKFTQYAGDFYILLNKKNKK